MTTAARQIDFRRAFSSFVVNKQNNNNKSQRPRCGGSTAAFCLAFFFFILELFLILLRFFELVERRQSRPEFPARMQRLGVARSVGVSAPSLTRARGAATQGPLHRALRRDWRMSGHVQLWTLAELVRSSVVFVPFSFVFFLPWPSRSSAVFARPDLRQNGRGRELHERQERACGSADGGRQGAAR